VVKDHLKPAMLYNAWKKEQLTEEQYERAVRRRIRRMNVVRPEVLVMVAEADFRGRAFPDRDTAEFLAGMKFLETVKRNGWTEGVPPLIQGRDLMEIGFSSGPMLGEILQTIEDAHDEGKIHTKEEALEMARKMKKSGG
jgi:hypothetical protein